MKRAVCPHCRRSVYSANTTRRIWNCPYCRRKFEPVYEDRLEPEGKEQDQ